MSESVIVVPYDANWPLLYQKEANLLRQVAGNKILQLEHIGSTAVPEQRAKPIIDMMGSITSLHQSSDLINALATLGYQLIPAGMATRHFLRKKDVATGQTYHLHLVEETTWPTRKERLMRDYLLANPESRIAYGKLKDNLAALYPTDAIAYTVAKTAFIQQISDQIQDVRGLPRINVWLED